MRQAKEQVVKKVEEERDFLNEFAIKTTKKEVKNLSPVDLQGVQSQFNELTKIVNQLGVYNQTPAFKELVTNYLTILQMRGDIDAGNEQLKLFPNEFKKLVGLIAETMLIHSNEPNISLQFFYEMLMAKLKEDKEEDKEEIEVPVNEDEKSISDEPVPLN